MAHSCPKDCIQVEVPAVGTSDQTRDHSPIVVQAAERAAVALGSILNPEQGTVVVEEGQ